MTPRERSLGKYSKIVMLIPPVKGSDGKMHAPAFMDGYLLPLLQELKDLGPDGKGFCLIE